MPRIRTTDSRLRPALIERFRMLTGPGVRIDTGVEEGDTIPSEFDSMIAKIIAYGQNRKEALARLQRVLHESVVVIKGGASNRAFLLDLLEPATKSSAATSILAGWIDWLPRVSTSRGDTLMLLLCKPRSKLMTLSCRVEQTQFYASAVRGRPQVRSEVGHTRRAAVSRPRLFHEGLSPRACGRYRIEVDGSPFDAHVERLGHSSIG